MDSSKSLTSSETWTLGFIAFSPLDRYTSIYQHKKTQSPPFSSCNSSRIAVSLRRYQRHCPIFSCCTRPAAVSTRIWCEMVGWESFICCSTSQAHMPELLPIEQHPCFLSKPSM